MADRFEICFTLAGTSGAVKTGLESGTMIAADETGGHAHGEAGVSLSHPI
jgi:hypothetical protein